MQSSSASRVFLLGNPAAGSGKGAAAMVRAEQALAERGIQPVVLRTQHPGHAVELAHQAVQTGAELLVVIGGDGTIRDCVQGLLRGDPTAPLPILGILPGGTGNDLVRTLQIPLSLTEALRIALGQTEAVLDVWTWNNTEFFNVAGVGLDAAVANVVNNTPRRIKGTLGYLLAALSTLPKFAPTELSLEMPFGSWTGNVWLVAFGNGRCYGGGMRIAPGANLRDGLLDVVIVEAMPRWELLSQLPGLFSGKHVRHPRVHVHQVEWVEVTGTPQFVTLDGELVGRVPGVIKRSPRGVRVKVPGSFS